MTARLSGPSNRLQALALAVREAELRLRQGQPHEGLQVALEARDALGELGQADLEAAAQLVLAECSLALGNRKEALVAIEAATPRLDRLGGFYPGLGHAVRGLVRLAHDDRHGADADLEAARRHVTDAGFPMVRASWVAAHVLRLDDALVDREGR
ncbi:MAG: hypothetical protein AAF602_19910 [Myxococcota bacterium]